MRAVAILLALAALLCACSANAATPAIGSGGGMSPDRVKTFRIPDFVCRPSNTPTNNGTNVCGQTTATSQSADCTFNDAIADAHSTSGDYKGAVGLLVIGWATESSTGQRRWNVQWVNATNQFIDGYGSYVYADMYCRNPDSHQLLKATGLKQ